MLASQRSFFGYPGNGEWLAGKSPYKNIMVRYLIHRNLLDITRRLFAKVGPVGLPTKCIDLRGEDATSPGRFQGQPESTYAREKVDESRRRFFCQSIQGGQPNPEPSDVKGIMSRANLCAFDQAGRSRMPRKTNAIRPLW